jgi:hypothetical protein
MNKPLDDNQKLIIKYLRKAWLYSKERRTIIKNAKTEIKNSEGEFLYKCTKYERVGVGQHHLVPKIYVDHIVPMVPLEGLDSWDKLINRLFDIKNMRTLCKMHHAGKTKLENAERRRLKNEK